MSPLGSLGGLQLTLIIPDTLVFMTVTALGDELGATATHGTVIRYSQYAGSNIEILSYNLEPKSQCLTVVSWQLRL